VGARAHAGNRLTADAVRAFEASPSQLSWATSGRC